MSASKPDEELNPELQYGAHILHPEFIELYNRGMAAVGMNENVARRPRFFHLLEMFKLTAGIPGAIAENGVFRGFTSYLLCHKRKLEVAGQFSGHGFFMLDSFEGLSEPVTRDGGHSHARWKERAFTRTSVETVRDVMAEFPDATIIQGWLPGTFDQLPEQAYRFAHIDVDIYEPTLACLEYYWPRLSPGGMILIDDYGPWPGGLWPGCAVAVQEFCQTSGIPYASLDTGNAVLIKR